MIKECKHNWMLVDKFYDDPMKPRKLTYIFFCMYCLADENILLDFEEADVKMRKMKKVD